MMVDKNQESTPRGGTKDRPPNMGASSCLKVLARYNISVYIVSVGLASES